MKQINLNRYHWLTLLYGSLTLLAIVLAGLVHTQQTAAVRGLGEPLPNPMPYAGVQFGLNVALEQYPEEWLHANLEQIDALGVRHLKQTIYWQNSTEPYDWTTADRIITAVNQYPNFQLTILLNGDPAEQFAPPQPDTFAAWAGEFASRYGDTIDYYMIWDEPNLTTQWGNQHVNPAAYGALLTAAAQAIRTADPTAVISTAPLAPTTEQGPQNLADPLFLQQLYEAGAQSAFDIVAGKPYGFDTPPNDPRIDVNVLNYKRITLLREVLERNGEGHKAVWAGNWGWNSLPANWDGPSSVWGQTDATTQTNQTIDALNQARQEWPWAGVLFLEGWEANAPADDPRHGFDLAGRPDALAKLQQALTTFQATPLAYPSFHTAAPDNPAQTYSGGWEFSPEFGADMSQVADGQPPDQLTFTFWGTDVGLRVRRADFRARFYVEIDGEPANALPLDNGRATLVLTTADPREDYIRTEPIAQNLEPGPHTLTLIADRGWDQWALKGFSVGYQPDPRPYQLTMLGLAIAAGLFFALTLRTGRRADWSAAGFGPLIHSWHSGRQLTLTAMIAAVVALTGFLTWGAEAAGLYRRLGDVAQMTLVATSAAVFYVTPWFFLYIVALLCFFILVYFRPSWGIAICAFCFPFYVPQLLKEVYVYRFSPIEIFVLVTFAAFVLAQLTHYRAEIKAQGIGRFLETFRPQFVRADAAVALFVLIATLSLFFTERLDVATNEWRLVIIEPALLYALIRGVKPSREELWRILDAFILGGVTVAMIGLWQYATGDNLIEAEAGLMRLRSIYGSPNNVALYLGRILPLLIATFLLGQQMNPTRRWLYTAALLPVGLAILLSFSRGAILLGVPAAVMVIFIFWQRENGRKAWPWLVTAAGLAVITYIVALQIPTLAGRLDLRSATGVFRLNLWQSSLQMIREQPVWGVGLDNFLYAYRGRYILAEAWQEPNLNHPHNIILDFATRLGLLGLFAGLWLFWLAGRALWRAYQTTSAPFRPVVLGFLAALTHTFTHGLVDHSFFLVDLAFAFFLLLSTAVWLTTETQTP